MYARQTSRVVALETIVDATIARLDCGHGAYTYPGGLAPGAEVHCPACCPCCSQEEEGYYPA